METTGDVHWNSQLERVISDEGERSLCFMWLHSHSEKLFTKLSNYVTIPVIIMSTISGSVSIGAPAIFPSQQVGGVLTGLVSLSVALLNTISSYFGLAKRSESHRISSTAYAKIYRFIMIELALPRSERMVAKDMLKVVREQCDRLNETSPQIPDTIIRKFHDNFANNTPDVKKPEITNGLDPIFIYPTSGTSSASSPLTRISSVCHTLDTSQKSSSVHPQSESATDNNRT
jgi:hypothetical protein